MALPGIRLTVVDGNLGLVSATADKPLVIGPASLGTPGTLYTFSQPSDVVSTLGRGQAVTQACHILDIAGGAVDVMVTSASTAATNGSVTLSGTGPLVSVSGSATERFDAIVRVREDGAPGVGRYDYSLDGGETYGSIRTIPSAGTFVVPNTGLTLTFAAITTPAVRTSGTSGPAVTLTGTPTALTDYDIKIEVDLGGIVSVATFRWSIDGGTTWEAEDVATAATVVLTGTGLTANFAAGTYVITEAYSWTTGYNADDTYTFAATPAMYTAANLDVAAAALLDVNDRWKFAATAGMAASASAAATLAEAVAGHMDDLADDFRMLRAIVHCGDDTETNVKAQFEDVESLRLCKVSGLQRIKVANPIEGWRNPEVPLSYGASALAAAFTRGTNMGWVGRGGPPNGGRLPKCDEISFDEFKEGEQMHDRKIVASRSFVGRAGYYLVNGLLACPAGSDFRYFHWGLAFDLLCETVADALLPFVNSSLRVNPDGTGTIHPLDAARINKQVNAAIRAAVLEPLTEQGTAGFFSAAEFAVDETYNILTTRTLRGDVRAVPLANTEQVEITAGLAAALAEQTAETTEEAA